MSIFEFFSSLHDNAPFLAVGAAASPKLSTTRITEAVIIAGLSAIGASAFSAYVAYPRIVEKLEENTKQVQLLSKSVYDLTVTQAIMRENHELRIQLMEKKNGK